MPHERDHVEWEGEITIDTEMWTEGWREKHADPAEQGTWAAAFVKDAFRKAKEDGTFGQDVEIGEVRYAGNRPGQWRSGT